MRHPSSLFSGILTTRQRTDFETEHYTFGEHCWFNDNLAINAKSPLHLSASVSILRNKSKQQTIVSWSRIDNSLSLCKTLNLNQRISNEISQTDIILEAYAKWGNDCVHHLIGDWVFCIWDDSKKELFIARDHIGHRSLFYYQASDFFIFSTSLSEILDHPNVPKKLNASAVVQLGSSVKRDAQTFYQGIYQLPCAHTLTINNRQSKLANYWLPINFKEVRYLHDDDYTSHFLELYTESVRCRIDNSKMGISLSSGLDSGSTAALAAPIFKAQGRKLEAFTWRALPTNEIASFRGRYADEIPLTQQLISFTGGINLNVVEGEKHNFLSMLKQDLEIFHEPTLSFIHINEIFEATEKQGIQSLLTGNWGNFIISHPGDPTLGFSEMISGSSSIGNDIYHWKKNHNATWRHVLNLLIRRKSSQSRKYPKKGIIQRNYINQKNLSEELDRYVPFTPHLEKLRQASTGRERHLFNMMQACAPGSISTLGNAYGIDIRTPTLDKRIIDFCMGIPNSQFLNKNGSKLLLKNAMKGKMPTQILYNKTRGIQAVDLRVKFLAESIQIGSILEQFQKTPLVSYWLDIPVLKQFFVEVCSPKTNNDTVFLKIAAIQRALTLGMFLTKFD